MVTLVLVVLTGLYFFFCDYSGARGAGGGGVAVASELMTFALWFCVMHMSHA